MSISCGFFDSVNGDRKYHASDMGKMFTGLINDGIFASIGDAFVVTAKSDNSVNVGTGKAWFNNTWIENDDEYAIDCESIGTAQSRYDAIVIKVDLSVGVRENAIEVYHGQEAKTPVKPDFSSINTEYVYYYPICYIYRKAGSTEVSQSDIANVVGTETPFVTGIVDVLDLATILKQWQAQLDDFEAGMEADYNNWYLDRKNLMASFQEELESWITARKNSFDEWFENIKSTMTGDAATNIILRLDRAEVENILINGFTNGQKTISDDGIIITSISSDGLTLVKTFTDDFLTSTTSLTDSNGVQIGVLVKNFSEDGQTITSTISTIYDTVE